MVFWGTPIAPCDTKYFMQTKLYIHIHMYRQKIQCDVILQIRRLRYKQRSRVHVRMLSVCSHFRLLPLTDKTQMNVVTIPVFSRLCMSYGNVERLCTPTSNTLTCRPAIGDKVLKMSVVLLDTKNINYLRELNSFQGDVTDVSAKMYMLPATATLEPVCLVRCLLRCFIRQYPFMRAHLHLGLRENVTSLIALYASHQSNFTI